MFSLSIIIPTYNGLTHLQRCLPSVQRYAPPNTQVLVVDDASTDNTGSWIRKHCPDVQLIALPTNQGFCHAANTGLQHARGDIIEFLNNDTEVTPGWAEAALSYFADESVGSVAPLVLNMNQRDRIDSAGVEYHRCGWAMARGYGQRLSEKYLQQREVWGASASCGFYRRSALEQTGGFRPEYEAYLEDVDLAFRLRHHGYRTIYEPASRVYHQGSASYDPMSERVVRLLARNEEYNFWMNLPAKSLLAGLIPHLCFQAVRALRKCWQGQLPPYLSGKVEALTNWRRIVERRAEMRGKHAGEMVRAAGSIWRNGVQWLLRRECA